MKGKVFLLSLSLMFLSGCQSPRESEFADLTKRAEAVAKNKNGSVSEREGIRKDFDNWSKKYGVQSVEQKAPGLLGFPTQDKPAECDWFARLEQDGKAGSCFARRELMVFENGEAKRACLYDCYYP